MKTLIVIILFTAFVLQGCSVKQTDSTGLKVAKHTANTPLYAVIAVGAVGTAAFTLAGAMVGAPIKGAVKGKNLDQNSTE